MKTPRTDMQLVTLLLHDMQGEAWRLSLSADCLCFIGNYRRIEGFNIDAIIALDGLRKDG
ncbi:hypothetical protein [Sphingobium sp. EM0848]|uniref:hypothetical protein n=1 Tax=Sphingobium sp. EM0848 TaxID=2743473 RepID=UPI00159CA21D|nr:hypothetical protein [Sphingobium sp. EM0848]